VLLSTLFLLAFTLFFFSQDTGWELVGVTYGVAAALGSFGVIGLFLRFADRPSKVMRFLSDASYWLYLVHLPLVFFFLFSLGINGFGAIATILLTSVLTIAIGLVTYKVFVRHTFISTLLNGKRHPLKS
jgi:peptidoglycan/LPS O-acetylase OafA/YrhL